MTDPTKLIGLVMMLADIHSRDLTVCGPPGLTHYVASTRFYARRSVGLLPYPKINELCLVAVILSPLGVETEVRANRDILVNLGRLMNLGTNFPLTLYQD